MSLLFVVSALRLVLLGRVAGYVEGRSVTGDGDAAIEPTAMGGV